MCDEQLCVRIVKTGKWFPLLHPTRVFLCVLFFSPLRGLPQLMVANKRLERDSMALHPL